MTATNKHLELWKQQLGMDFSLANQKLMRMVVWNLAKICGMDNCYQCKQPIVKPEQLSLEHKQPWRGANGRESRPDLFWNLDNIAFSHTWCNCGSPTRGQGNRKYFGVDDYGDTRDGRTYRKIRARLGMDNKSIDLGYWDNEIKAAISYDLAVIHYRNGCGVLNFEFLRDDYNEYIGNHGYPNNSKKRGRLKPWVNHFLPKVKQHLADKEGQE